MAHVKSVSSVVARLRQSSDPGSGTLGPHYDSPGLSFDLSTSTGHFGVSAPVGALTGNSDAVSAINANLSHAANPHTVTDLQHGTDLPEVDVSGSVPGLSDGAREFCVSSAIAHSRSRLDHGSGGARPHMNTTGPGVSNGSRDSCVPYVDPQSRQSPGRGSGGVGPHCYTSDLPDDCL